MGTAKNMSVLKVKSGDRINTTSGMREVLSVDVHASFVAVHVNDPASRTGKTVLDYYPDATVTVERTERSK